MKLNKFFGFTLVLGAAFVSSCQNEEDFSNHEGEVALEILTATEHATRTSLVDGKSVVWNEGDAIAVYDFAATKRKFVAEINEGTTRFKGNITPKYGSFVAAYPYDLAAENDVAKSIVMHLPSTQTAVVDGFGPDLNLSIAKGERNVDGSPSQVTFRNICQLMKLGIPEYIAGRVAKIEFSASQAIAGQLLVDYSDFDPAISADNQGSKVVTLLPPTGKTSFAEGTYYMALAPVALDGFVITLTDINGKTYTQGSNSTIGGINGFIYNLGNLDLIDKPTITSQHVYEDGALTGTTVSMTAPVSDKAWSATIKNAQGTIVRTLAENIGVLTSDNTDETWPYLPKGEYTVDYTYMTANGKPMSASSQFQITEDPTFTLTMTANSSYSYYLNSNVDKANAMDAYQVDGITSVVGGISQAILSNANYTFTRSNSFEGVETAYENGTTQYDAITITQLGESTLSTTFTFDGVSKTATQNVYITGLPFLHQPPTGDKWSANNGQTSFEDDHVKTGAAGSNGSFSYQGISVPAGTMMELTYKVDVYMDNALSTQKYQIIVGDQTVFNHSTSSTGTKSFDESKTFSNSNIVNNITCYTGYCYGRSNSKTYKIGLSYGK